MNSVSKLREKELSSVSLEKFNELNLQAFPRFGITRDKLERAESEKGMLPFHCVTISPTLLWVDEENRKREEDLPQRFAAYTHVDFTSEALDKLLRFTLETRCIITTEEDSSAMGGRSSTESFELCERPSLAVEDVGWSDRFDFVYSLGTFGVGFTLCRIIDRELVRYYVETSGLGFTAFSPSSGSAIYLSIPFEVK